MNDKYFMEKALELAEKAEKKGEVPIGALIVKNGKIISKAFNKREKKQNALYHAEILAINKACKKLKSWRLDDCVLYCTLEPCIMCSGAIVNARIQKVVFGAYEKKSGAVVSKYSLLNDNGLNHNCLFLGGIKEEECKTILVNFFKNQRRAEITKK